MAKFNLDDYNLDDYETVDSRIHRFYGDHPGGAIRTVLVASEGPVGGTRWIMRATILRASDSEQADATGYAFEVDGTGTVNNTSALENCETSAIGRALANLGYSGDKRASREEMEKVQRASTQEKSPEPPEGWRQLVASCGTSEDLMKLYDAEGRFWWTEAVKDAFTARKEVLRQEQASDPEH